MFLIDVAEISSVFGKSNSIKYYNEVMSGFEYATAASLLQYGLIDEGLDMVKTISERYDGRLRAEGEVHMAHMSTVFGTGSPIGEDDRMNSQGNPVSLSESETKPKAPKSGSPGWNNYLSGL